MHDKSIGHVFGHIEEQKEFFGIAEYSVTQTTLEQIFQMFANSKRADVDDIDELVWADILQRQLPVTGAPPNGTWATTRAGAMQQLEHFVENVLPEFGPYEDAMPADTW